MVVIEPIFHRGIVCIAIRGKYRAGVLTSLRRLVDLRYSATHKCYYTPFELSRLEELRKELPTADPELVDLWNEKIAHSDFRMHLPENQVEMPASYRDHLIKRRYSEATRVNYEAQFKAFLKYIYPKAADEFSDAEIHAYQLYLAGDRKVSHSTQNQAINAIKFYLEQVKKGERREYYIERPRHEFKLPTVLSEGEIRALFEKTH